MTTPATIARPTVAKSFLKMPSLPRLNWASASDEDVGHKVYAFHAVARADP